MTAHESERNRDIAAAAVSALDETMPAAARSVCARLAEAGYQAVAVGGAVRDAVLGRVPGDWDVATSATPDEVQTLFARTIPTGLDHGTVTVMMGRGAERLPIEVTTFRGEGAYSDGRRPDSVTFGVPLKDDLARRDFVINAMAYDPVARTLIDPFGGCRDIAGRRIRAVGVAAERFSEDGLRVMRAVRFAAVLGFDLESDTEAAIPGSLPILARVSRERVREELLRMLRAEQPSRGLDIARRTGILDQILPEIARSVIGDEVWLRARNRVDAVRAEESRSLIRLAALLCDVAGSLPPAKKPAHPLRRLKMSNQDIASVARLLGVGLLSQRLDSGNGSDDPTGEPTDAHLRTMLGAVGRAHADELLSLWRADAASCAPPGDWMSSAALDKISRAETFLARGDALTIGELAVSGADLLEHLQIPPGRAVGELLQALLAEVIEHPRANQADALFERARALHARSG